jgi:hypothetical protein
LERFTVSIVSYFAHTDKMDTCDDGNNEESNEMDDENEAGTSGCKK